MGDIYSYPEWWKMISSDDEEIEDFQIGPEIEKPGDDLVKDDVVKGRYVWARVNYVWVPLYVIESRMDMNFGGELGRELGKLKKGLKEIGEAVEEVEKERDSWKEVAESREPLIRRLKEIREAVEEVEKERDSWKEVAESREPFIRQLNDQLEEKDKKIEEKKKQIEIKEKQINYFNQQRKESEEWRIFYEDVSDKSAKKLVSLEKKLEEKHYWEPRNEQLEEELGKLKKIEDVIKKMSQGTDWMANRYDTDDTYHLCLYRYNETVDIIIPKDME